jgi:hypothetical protein
MMAALYLMLALSPPARASANLSRPLVSDDSLVAILLTAVDSAVPHVKLDVTGRRELRDLATKGAARMRRDGRTKDADVKAAITNFALLMSTAAKQGNHFRDTSGDVFMSKDSLLEALRAGICPLYPFC